MGMSSACCTDVLAGYWSLKGLQCQHCDVTAVFPIAQRRSQKLLLNDSLPFHSIVILWLPAFSMTLMILSVEIRWPLPHDHSPPRLQGPCFIFINRQVFSCFSLLPEWLLSAILPEIHYCPLLSFFPFLPHASPCFYPPSCHLCVTRQVSYRHQ